VENAFRAQGNIDYGPVDRVESITVSPEELYNFLVEGRLNTGE
jgi:hypothetical protein